MEEKQKIDLASATVNVPIAKVKPYEDNAKKHPKGQVTEIAKSITKYGRKQPIVVDQDHVIIVGHGRYAAAKMLGLKEIPCVIANDLTEEEIREYRLEDNRTNESKWILEKLVKELKVIDSPAMRASYNHLLPENLADLEIDEKKYDATPEAPNPVDCYVKEWDVYQLGNHRIICGDSTDPYTRQKLMTGIEHKADMVFTDPPYWVSYTGSNGKDAKQRDMIKNDHLRGDALFQMLVWAFKNVAQRTREQAAFYICYATTNHMTFELAVREAELTPRQVLIREKQMVLGRADYHRNYEPMLYVTKEKRAKRYGDRTRKTKVNTFEEEDYKKMTKDQLLEFVLEARQDRSIFKIDRANTSEYVHPTQKPVELCATFIKNSSPFGGIVLEPFAWSGSTLIAAHVTWRKCYASELDPIYVQVIIKRREELTGLTAKKID